MFDHITPDIGSRKYLSPHFTRSECACQCGECKRFSADTELVDVMELLRSDLGGHPVSVLSWFRCMDHNCRAATDCNSLGVYGAGSVEGSYHPQGTAVDFRIANRSNSMIAQYIRHKYPKKFGLGVYSWGVHLDVGPYRDWQG